VVGRNFLSQVRQEWLFSLGQTLSPTLRFSRCYHFFKAPALVVLSKCTTWDCVLSASARRSLMTSESTHSGTVDSKRVRTVKLNAHGGYAAVSPALNENLNKTLFCFVLYSSLVACAVRLCTHPTCTVHNLQVRGVRLCAFSDRKI
jgi:hypothetical protein